MNQRETNIRELMGNATDASMKLPQGTLDKAAERIAQCFSDDDIAALTDEQFIVLTNRIINDVVEDTLKPEIEYGDEYD